MEELNKKLAEWRWGASVRVNSERIRVFDISKWSQGKGGEINYEDYDLFTQSLDACFKWLVPKLEALYINYGGDAFYACAYFKGERQEKIAETPALALCSAVERLIDGGKDAVIT